ncbi:hypothetical protein [Streptomyces mesophilus]|uniref:hypothetical protein n=1 Tax=Streptomyces mesophilus TaxID=1775132 RepID=UPI003333BE6B
MKPMKRTTLAARAAALLVAALLLSGCGGSDEGSQVASVNDAKSPSAAGKADEAEQAQEFVTCMRDNGVEMADPDPATGKLDLEGVVGGGADRETLTKAMDACRDKAPQSLQDVGGKPDAEQLEAMKKLAACMRKNGVEMADPGPEGFEQGSLTVDDPDFEKAMDACRDLLGAIRGGAQ